MSNSLSDPVGVIESLIYWNTDTGMCQGCQQPKKQLSVLESYFPLNLYTLLFVAEGEDAKYAAVSGVATIADEQIHDYFVVSQTKLLCEKCLKSAFAGFVKKDAYEMTRQGIEREAKNHRVVWSALIYCLLLDGGTRQDLLYKSRSSHIAIGGYDFRPPLHDVLTMGNDAARQNLSMGR